MPKRQARYTVRFSKDVCDQIALGKTLKEALAWYGPLAPSLTTCMRWLDEYPDFNERYERARQLQADSHADRLLELGKEVLDKPGAAAAYRVATDILKWQAEVRNKSRYGKTSDDQGKNKPLDPVKLRAEIKRLEAELGVAESKVKPLKVVKKESNG